MGVPLYKTTPWFFRHPHLWIVPDVVTIPSTTLTMASPSSSQGITTRPILIQSGPITVSIRASVLSLRGLQGESAWIWEEQCGVGLYETGKTWQKMERSRTTLWDASKGARRVQRQRWRTVHVFVTSNVATFETLS